jgi:predicted Zn finger-like uncharacterized protein
MTPSLRIRCPNCRASMDVSQNSLGRSGRCSRCSHRFTLSIIDAPEASSSQRAVSSGPSSAVEKERSGHEISGKLGRYEIRAKLGSGAFGAVYRAYDPHLNRELALKVPHPDTMDSAEIIDRFLTEARAAARLQHPGIVPVYDAGNDGSLHFIASAFVEGKTLEESLKSEVIEVNRAVQIVLEIAEALAHAHESGIVHRDVKPSNVMVDRRGRVFLTDFGLAHLAESAAKLTQDGTVLGTPAYMAPEQAAGRRERVLPSSDQYSLGVILYELVCGRRPFIGPSSLVIFHNIHSPPPRPCEIRPELDPALEAICLKTLSKDPENRYPGCRELADDLRRFLQPEARGASKEGEPGPLPSRWSCRRVVAIGAGLSLLCLAGVLWVSSRFRSAATARGPNPINISGKTATAANRMPLRPPITLDVSGLKKQIRYTGSSPAETAPQTKPNSEQLPLPFQETAPEWVSGSPDRSRQIQSNREEALRGLTEVSLNSHPFAGQFQAGLGGRGEIPVMPQGEGAARATRPSPPPERFILSGSLGAVRATRGGTWVYLNSASQDGAIPPGAFRPSFPAPVILIPNEKAVEWLADYRAGDQVRAVVKRQDWGTAPSIAVPPNGPPPELQKLLREMRLFLSPLGLPVARWCLNGEGIEKSGDPESWIDPKLGRERTISNTSELRRSPGFMLRSSPPPAGEGRIKAAFNGLKMVNGKVWLLLTIQESIEGPIDVLVGMGPTPQAWEFMDYAAGTSVQAVIKLIPAPELIMAFIQDPRTVVSRSSRAFASDLGANMFLQMGPIAPGAPPAQDPWLSNLAIVATCNEIQREGDSTTRVAATGPRRKIVPIEEITPDVALATQAQAEGQVVRWSGTLRIVRRQAGETHFLFAVPQSIFGACDFEAFTKQADFFDDVWDYADSQSSGSQGDNVEVLGEIRATESASYRLSERVPLLLISQVERKGHPDSIAIVGQKRDPRTMSRSERPIGWLAMMRDRPSPGSVLNGSGLFSRYEDSDHLVSIKASKDSPFQIKLSFPKSSKSTFADYHYGDQVEVTGVCIDQQDDPAKAVFALAGRQIVRTANPLSIVTADGRPTPPLDFGLDKEKWRKIRSNPSSHIGENIVSGGIFKGVSRGTSYLKIDIGKAFFDSGDLELICGLDPEAEKTLATLEPNIEITFEFAVSDYNTSRYHGTLVWLAPVAHPDRKRKLPLASFK